jgi:hypothetical protein
MRLAKPILMAVIVVALAAYGFDCYGLSRTDEAMQCCDTMPCPPHSHDGSQDCCKTMPSLQAAPFVQPPAHSQSVTLVFFAVAPMVSTSQGLNLSTNVILLAADSHAPPISQSAALSPLRI